MKRSDTGENGWFFFSFIYKLYSWCEMREYFRAKAEIVREQEHKQTDEWRMGEGGYKLHRQDMEQRKTDSSMLFIFPLAK